MGAQTTVLEELPAEIASYMAKDVLDLALRRFGANLKAKRAVVTQPQTDKKSIVSAQTAEVIAKVRSGIVPTKEEVGQVVKNDLVVSQLTKEANTIADANGCGSKEIRIYRDADAILAAEQDASLDLLFGTVKPAKADPAVLAKVETWRKERAAQREAKRIEKALKDLKEKKKGQKAA